MLVLWIRLDEIFSISLLLFLQAACDPSKECSDREIFRWMWHNTLQSLYDETCQTHGVTIVESFKNFSLGLAHVFLFAAFTE